MVYNNSHGTFVVIMFSKYHYHFPGNSQHKLGEGNIQQANASASSLRFSSNISNLAFTFYTYHVGRRDDFGYGYEFLLIIVAVAFGVSVPYFIGSIFHPKIQAWLDRHPKKASKIRLTGEGTWFNQFQAVTLIRISPSPMSYIITVLWLWMLHTVLTCWEPW